MVSAQASTVRWRTLVPVAVGGCAVVAAAALLLRKLYVDASRRAEEDEQQLFARPGASIVEPATVVAAGAVATSKKLVASEKEEADVEEAEWETEEDEEVDDKELELEVGDALEQVMREEIMKKLKEKRERTGSDKRAEQQMAEDDAELERLTQEYFEFGRDRQKFMERALGTDENDEVPWGDEEDPEDEDGAAAPPPEPLTEDERLLQQLRAERGEPAFLQPAADNANAVDEIEATEEDLEEGAPSKKKPHTAAKRKVAHKTHFKKKNAPH